MNDEASNVMPNSQPETQEQPLSNNYDALLAVIEADPAAKQAILAKLINAQLPKDNAETKDVISPAINDALTQVPTTPMINFQKATAPEFINYRVQQGESDTALKAHLLQRYPELSGSDVDQIASEAARRVQKSYDLTGEFPSNAEKEKRLQALIICEEASDHYKNSERSRIDLRARHIIAAEREFGSNHAHRMMEEVLDYYSKTLEIPREEMEMFPAEKIEKYFRSYTKRSMTPVEESYAEKNRRNELDNLISVMNQVK